MKATAIICECNPFHHGHKHIFEIAKKRSDCVIAIMSGNFVQRAEAAVFDKYARAEAVLNAGADLVLELPFPWCSASAEYFARAGVSIACDVRADTLVFGATRPSVDEYFSIAEFLSSDAYYACAGDLSNTENKTIGTAQIREACVREHLGDRAAQLMREANDILAIEYCRAIMEYKHPIEPVIVTRISQVDNPQFRGASSLRESLRSGELSDIRPYIPEYAYDIFANEWAVGRCALKGKCDDLAFHTLRGGVFGTAGIADGSDGVLARLIRCARESVNADQMYCSAATKKYTNTRFRRVGLYSMLLVNKNQIAEKPRFTELLATSSRGCQYLSLLRKQCGITILTKPSASGKLSEDAKEQYQLQCRADELYTLCTESVQFANAYLRRTPYIEKSNNKKAAK